MSEATQRMLDHTNPDLRLWMHAMTGYEISMLNTGGGCMVLVIDMEETGRMMGPYAWLTREEDWLLGFYLTPDDDGRCVSLVLPASEKEKPRRVAEEVHEILRRVGFPGMLAEWDRKRRILGLSFGYSEDGEGSVDALIEYKNAIEDAWATDSVALDRINKILSDPEWAPGMLEDICSIVRATGRVAVAGAEWERH